MQHKTRGSLTLAAFLAVAAAATAAAQNAPVRLRSITIASEALAAHVTLPTGADGALVMAPCAGCPARSFPTNTGTTYELNGEPVSVATLRAALLANPQSIVTVSYVVDTGVVTQVSAAP